MNITMSELINGIINEISSKTCDYICFMAGSLHTLYKGLYGYVNEKVYNTSFGDLVPQIIANAIKINIIIVSGTQSQGYTTHYVPCTRAVTKTEVIIWKNGIIMMASNTDNSLILVGRCVLMKTIILKYVKVKPM